MSWKVTSTHTGRWIGWTDGHLDGDPETRDDVDALLGIGATVPETVTGPFYQTRGEGDERGAYLLALYVLPGAGVTGDPPAGPERSTTPIPDGAVY
jgi:hypothetical protein